MAEMDVHFFSPGEEVEIGNNIKGFKGSWYAATVLLQTSKSDRPSRSSSKRMKNLLVEYKTLMANRKGVKPLQEYVNLSLIRPKPPQEEPDRSFQVNEKVEAFDNDGWWEGTISKVLENQRYGVYFKETEEEIQYNKSDLRTHLEWINGRWVCAAVAQEQQTLEPAFSRGSLVEVCLDDDTRYGAWFPATVLKEIDSNCFLVEFQKLRLHARAISLKDTVDSRHIRPFPPQTSQVKYFRLSEKVDAFSDGGWRSGIINRILSDGRYTVLFEHPNKLKEFSHSELRIHMVWTDGKWSENSKEISVAQHNQCGTESPLQALFEEPGNTYEIIDLTSPLGLDSTKNVAAKSLPRQAQTQQDRKTLESTDMAHPSSDNAVKTTASKKSHSSRISRKLDYQLSSKKPGSPGKAHNLDAAKKIGSETSPILLSGQAIKAPMPLIACSVRGISIGTLHKASGQHDFTTQTTDSRVTNVEGKRARNLAVDEHFWDHSFKRYSKEHLEPSNSGQDQTKHDLESNWPRNHPSVERCSSHLPNSIHIEEGQVVHSTQIQTLAQQTKLEVQMPRQKRKPFGGDDNEQNEMEGVSKQKTYAFYKRRISIGKVSNAKASARGPEHTAACIETSNCVVRAEETLKQIEMDRTPNDNRHSDQQVEMCIESCLSSTIEKGVSSATQPMAIEAITRKDAIRDECNEYVMQSFLINEDTPREDESLPFAKCSSYWENVEVTEVFHAIPQQLHFRPLKELNMELREGFALGLTISFTNIVKKVEKAEVDDPPNALLEWSKALEYLKAYGFNVQPIQARLETLIRIKDEQAMLKNELIEVENQINMNNAGKISKEKEIDEITKNMRELQESINQLRKTLNQLSKKLEMTVLEKEVQDSSMAELKKTKDILKGCLHSVTAKFRTVVATPW